MLGARSAEINQRTVEEHQARKRHHQNEDPRHDDEGRVARVGRHAIMRSALHAVHSVSVRLL
jgi:hypothetical protein